MPLWLNALQRPKTMEKAQLAFLLWVELEAAEAFLVSDSSADKCSMNRFLKHQSVEIAAQLLFLLEAIARKDASKGVDQI
ncbi:Protein MOR1 [Dendrobium catenatum]|uniref:Protein MOR1 n=1 Tax=Dendrobium catenatum TaxID=906689 RepID=A0A2I0VNQ2_9ASPA|nr:Protein MOR1 [Dendrobium catenatum]